MAYLIALNVVQTAERRKGGPRGHEERKLADKLSKFQGVTVGVLSARLTCPALCAAGSLSERISSSVTHELAVFNSSSSFFSSTIF